MARIAASAEPDGEDDKKEEWKESYTLANVETHRAADIKRAIDLLSRGIPKWDIARACKMHFYTVSEIERRYLPDIAQRREHAAAKAYSALTASLDSATERAVKGQASALDAKMLADTYLSLSGEASTIIEVQHSFGGLDEFDRAKVMDAVVVGTVES